MQDKCSVPACQGNYDVSNKVAVFGFPTDKDMRGKWLQAIPRKNFKIRWNSKTDLGTEFQNVAETSIVFKQEPEESVDEPLQLVIGQVFSAEELLSSPVHHLQENTTNSSSTYNIPPVPENVLPIANPDSTNLDQTPATHVSNKTAPKRKINDAELDANGINPDASQSKLCRRAKPSMSPKRNINLHQHAGISKKSTGRSTLPT
ncbi:unnamed protein product [Larinioides sclopetarius]|uniref:THAP-type domain-containing protein n=1 Tax=Larinioides sclopetarius TaxID=280406 RepID=A0AAV2BID1_9ARAC